MHMPALFALCRIFLVVEAFSSTSLSKPLLSSKVGRHILHSTFFKGEKDPIAIYKPVFDFFNTNADAVSKFERIDDAIMGGISLSALKQLPNEEFARWSGICRIDGG